MLEGLYEKEAQIYLQIRVYIQGIVPPMKPEATIRHKNPQPSFLVPIPITTVEKIQKRDTRIVYNILAN